MAALAHFADPVFMPCLCVCVPAVGVGSSFTVLLPFLARPYNSSVAETHISPVRLFAVSLALSFASVVATSLQLRLLPA